MNETGTEAPDGRRSWLVAFVGALAMIFTFGTAFSYGVFTDPFSEAFGLEPVVLSSVFAVMLFSFYIGAGVVGILASYTTARTLLLVCAAITGLIAPSLYVVDSLGGLVAVFTLLGVSLGTVFILLASVVPSWFETHRGAATGLIFTGNGLGLLVLPPFWQFALERGVADGFFLVMSISALSFLLAGLVCRRPSWVERSSVSPAEVVGWLGSVGRTRGFQVLLLGVSLSFAWYPLLAVYAIDLFQSRGLSAAGGSLAFGLIGGVSLVSRLGGGYVADRVGFRRTFLASLYCAAVGAVLLYVPGIEGMLVAIVFLGLGLGGAATLYVPVLMRSYSREKDTAILGVFSVGIGVFSLGMPPIGAATIAYTGGYTVAIALTVLALAGSILGVSAHARY